MAKSLDGVKKLNPGDIKKYRKLVLNYIGEKDSAGANEQKDSSQAVPSSKRVDGINLNEISRFGSGQTRSKRLSAPGGLPPASPGGQTGVLGGGKEESAPQLAGREDERLREAIKRQEEERKKIKAEEKQYRLDKERAERERREQAEESEREKIKLEKERVRQEEIRQKESQWAEEVKKWEEKIRLAELEKEEKRRVEENLRLEKMKREEEIKKIKREMEIKKQAAREKKKLKRQKVWRKIKKNLNFKAQGYYLAVKRNITYALSFLAISVAIVYLVFCLAVLRFKVDNNLTAQLFKLLPLPAAVTNQGIIGYLDYKKIENKDYLSLSLAEKKNYLARWIILNNLKRKYGSSANAADDDLAIKYVLDKDLNQVPLARINKINSLAAVAGFESLAKYADEYSDNVYYDASQAAEKFGPAVLELAVGQVSNIIPRAQGHYLVKRIDDKNGQLGFKELFIKARTLDQYVSERLEKIKVFILAD